jgi:hypothetical protein
MDAYRYPGSAISGREKAKHKKYDAYAASVPADFVAFALDTYGCLGTEALGLVKRILSESSLSSPSPYGMSRADFLSKLLVLWHRHNALVFIQWSTRARNDALRRAKQAYNRRAPSWGLPLVSSRTMQCAAPRQPAVLSSPEVEA